MLPQELFKIFTFTCEKAAMKDCNLFTHKFSLCVDISIEVHLVLCKAVFLWISRTHSSSMVLAAYV